MASTVFPAASAASKTRYVVELLSGTSWTVPAGCLYVNATLYGAGGGGGGSNGSSNPGSDGRGGQVVITNLATTPANSIAYAIGAGGSAQSAGGNTTFTGATTATGGALGAPSGHGGYTGGSGSNGEGAGNGAGGGGAAGGTGGSGKIALEYWI